MISRFGIALILLLTGLNASAWLVEDSVCPNPAKLNYHMRVSAKRGKVKPFGVKWNMTDSINYRYLSITPLDAPSDETLSDCVDVSLGHVVNGTNIVEDKHTTFGKFELTKPAYSIRISVGDAGAILELGSSSIVERINIQYDRPCYGNICAYGQEDTQIIRHTVYADCRDEIQYANFAEVESLYQYLRQSTDNNEGIWTYFDRNTNALRCRLGGKYSIATIKNGNGYDIVYLGGADELSDSWKPLRIKGHLQPVSISCAFMLEWICPDGLKLSYETGAMIDNNILTLQFPYWKSTLRFTRGILPSDNK